MKQKTQTLVKATVPLCLTFLLLVMSVFLLLRFVSTAWFSFADSPEADGMSLGLRASNDLIISDTVSEILKPDISTVNHGSPFTLSADTEDTRFIPSTHDSAYGTGLKYVKNTDAVSILYGTGTGTLIYENAENLPGEKQYYRDFTVYIASSGVEMTDVALYAEVFVAEDEEAEVHSGSLLAASVDFYRGSVSQENYIGTLNGAGLDPEINDSVTERHRLFLLGSSEETATIPCRTSQDEKYLTYVLRCYFDGALKKDEDHTFINSATLDVSQACVTVTFTAYEPVSG